MIWSVQYSIGNNLYSMHLYGTAEEVQQHCENLGLDDAELVNEFTPLEGELNIVERLN